MFFNSEFSNKKLALSPVILVIVSAICSLGLAFVSVPVVAGVIVAVSAAVLVVTSERKPLTVIVSPLWNTIPD